MRFSAVFVIIIIFLSSVNIFSQYNRIVQKNNTYYLANTVIFKLKNHQRISSEKHFTADPVIQSFFKEEGSVSLQYIFNYSDTPEKQNLNGIIEASYSSGTDPEIVSAKMKKLPDVEWCEPRYIYEPSYVPNDPLYSTQYSLTKIQAPQAWDITRGDTSIAIGIIDTGVDWDHPDLAANIWRNHDEIQGNGIDDDANGFIDDIRGWDFGGLTGIPDNNPMEDRPDHGTHVAGIASAVSDNSIGVASIGYRSKIMAVKTSRDDVRNNNGTALIVYGYEGIYYAAENGAKIVNLSWGGEGYSIFGQEVINSVTELGCLVVGAAGNNQSSSPFYPASYDKVLSIASTTADDVRSFFSNYGITVDVSAPGTNIHSTWQNDTYIYTSGTSMSAPLVAGLAALVTAQFPLFNPLQVGEQIRTNSDDIYSLNPSYNYMLGKGRINAFKSLSNTTAISVRAGDFSFSDEAPYGDGDGIFEPGETIAVRVEFTNYLNTTSSLVINLEKNNNFSTVLNNSFNAGQKGTLEIFDNNGVPFTFQIAANVPQNSDLMFRLTYSDAGYTDFQMFRVLVNPSYADQTNGTILLTIASDGTLGFNNFPDNTRGKGFRYSDTTNLLFEGALMMGVSNTRISDAARVTSTRHAEFTTVQPFLVSIPGMAADQQGFTIFNDDAASTGKLGVTVKLHTYTYSNDEDDDYIILRYIIRNSSTTALSGFYTGLFFDWDFADASSDITEYDPSGNLGFVRRTTGNPDTWIASAVISQTTPGFYAIRNDGTQGNINLFDANGYTDAEKWTSISSGIGIQQTGPGDISHVISSGPFDIAAGDSVDVAFAIAGGMSLDELRNSVARARTKFQGILVDINDEIPAVPAEFSLEQNYPNPFNPSTVIKYSVAEQSLVTMKLYDVLGNEVASLVNEVKAPGSYEYKLNSESLSSGVYFYSLKAGNFTAVRKMILVK